MKLFLKFLSIKKIYQQETHCEKLKYAVKNQHEQYGIEYLPTALKNYLNHCGYKQNNQLNYCQIKWKYTYLKMAPGKKWLPVQCNQVNFLPDPARIALYQARLFGLFPFAARDKFQDGKGNMLIKLLRYFTIANDSGNNMDIAELVTLLAEAVLIPDYFLQPYIKWEEIDAYTVKGIISYRGISASGIFYFNEYNEFLRFETEDRYYNNKGKFEKYKWSAYAWNYKNINGFILPVNFMAIWHMPQSNYTYFKGRVEEVIYNNGNLR